MGMERLHGAADEIKNDGSQDQGDEQAAEKSLRERAWWFSRSRLFLE